MRKKRKIMRKAMALLAAMLLALGFPAIAGSAAQAQADPCTGTWSIVMGGFTLAGPGVTGETSAYLIGDQPVGYNSADPMSGYNELNRLFWLHRSQCPADHIKIVGHSEGAGIVHAWVTNNQGAGNYNAVLLADPKRDAGPGGPGLSSTPGNQLIGYPLAGTDNWFGGVPVLEVCNHDDEICDTSAGWYGYLFAGAHSRYDFNAYDYSNTASGVWYR
ncbi:cutinase family protein [Nocardia jiangxiensis]|uniref:cutinase family protein n=1 Tax=Nocardia jiangxiensis TaxID=282685 RepID=UPI001C3F3F44|nr:cutinase family protein [Nocardia jiangxiensis]